MGILEMKSSTIAVLAIALALVTQIASANIISCDFASEAGASIKFTGTGDTIEFPNAVLDDTDLPDFVITKATSANLGGLHGNIGGTFQVGTIVSNTPFPGILVEQAPVTTIVPSTFSVNDGQGHTLTAGLDWKDITVFSSTFGAMNATATTNLSSVSYDGDNVDLLSIKHGSGQTVTLSFQFSAVTQRSLSELMTDGQVNSTSYSGSLSAVPEPSSCVLLGICALGLVAQAWKRRK